MRGWVSASGRWIRCVSDPSGAWVLATNRDSKPFDAQWKEAAWSIVRTFRAQQRKQGLGPYSFERTSAAPTDTCALGGFGNPARPWA